ncbi:MAG: ABC transporter ATP-binding protein [Phycisphaerae bacterium]|jgi:ABC-type dipeptide/oligopeptide/nickel transport system ATPase component|nr:ABC transporter ATP-binding protein [Phycisphaerae bacterium]
MLDVKNLRITFGNQIAVDGIDFSIEQGGSLAIVGESGSGKSVTALSILGLLPNNARVSGEILFEEYNISTLSSAQMQQLRGKKIAIVFQEPMTSLNPVFSIGEQIMETLLAHENLTRQEAKQKTLLALEEVGIPKERFKSYPHEFSGGMRQRVVIAIALACTPDLLIADEPTTALDASTSLQIIELLNQLQRNRNMAIIFITHDLCLVPSIAEHVCVMRSGKIVEKGKTSTVLEKPTHPYTTALTACVPSIYKKYKRLPTI